MKAKEPLISVIFPIYNVEQWVEESLQSVCDQDYRNLEIVVINDGSKDSSRAICEQIAKQDSRVVIIDQENGGLSAARNSGIEKSQGEYIVFVDSDDLISRNHISSLYKCMQSHETMIACTVMTRFEGEFNAAKDEPMICQVYSSEDAVKEIFYQGRFDSCAQAKIYAKELWDDVRFPVGYLHEDLPTTYKVFLKAKSIAFFDSTTYGYRFNPNGINHSVTDDRKIKTLDLVNEVSESFKNDYPQLIAPLRCLRVSYCLHCLLNAQADSISKENEIKLKETIIVNRNKIIKDKNARKKTKIALMISFFGWLPLKIVFRIVS